MASFTTFTDPLTSSVQNTGLWTGNFGTLSWTGGGFTVSQAPAYTSYGGMQTIATYDLTGAAAWVSMGSVGDQSIVSLETIPLNLIDGATGTNKLFFYINQNNLTAYKVISGTQTVVKTSPYLSGIHKWFRIRELSGTTYFETSADGESWTLFVSLANPITVTGLYIAPSLGTFSSEAKGTSAHWNSFNFSPSYPINAPHRLLLENGSYLLLETGDKFILDEVVALDDPVAGATGVSTTPTVTFAGENLQGNQLNYEIQFDTVNTFNSPALLDRNSTVDPGFADDVTNQTASDSLLLEDGTYLLMETGDKLLLNQTFAQSDSVSFTVQPNDFLNGGTLYYWQVRTITAGGVASAWSSTGTFTTLRPLLDFSYGGYASLPTDNSRLTFSYSPTQVTNVGNISNTIDVNDPSNLTYRVHQYAIYQATGSQITATFKGKAGLATSTANMVLQAYNTVTPGWVTLATDSTSASGATVTLTGTISATFAPYFSGNYITFRVYQ